MCPFSIFSDCYCSCPTKKFVCVFAHVHYPICKWWKWLFTIFLCRILTNECFCIVLQQFSGTPIPVVKLFDSIQFRWCEWSSYCSSINILPVTGVNTMNLTISSAYKKPSIVHLRESSSFSLSLSLFLLFACFVSSQSHFEKQKRHVNKCVVAAREHYISRTNFTKRTMWII